VTTKDYEGIGIVVHWDSDRCIHSERCTAGAPAVFDKSARPWVTPDGASADTVARVIDTCPSGALSYTRLDGARNGRRGRALDEDPAASIAADTVGPSPHGSNEARAVEVSISPLENGPLSIVGPVALTRPDGSGEIVNDITLCRCGQSGSKPRCDGSHVRVGFVADGVR
jgi:uncharacterized Fe-S cluster protein YjdI